MRGNQRKRRTVFSWLSLLIVAAMVVPMFSAIALAEEAQAAVEEIEFELAGDDTGEPEEPEMEAEAEDGDAILAEYFAAAEAATAPDSGTGIQEELVIYDFEEPEKPYYELSSKPSLAEARASLPATLTALLSNGEREEVPVTWTTDEDTYAEEDYGEFIFTAQLGKGAKYALDDDEFEMPYVSVYVLYVSDIQIDGEDTYVVSEKPAPTDAECADILGFPVTATITVEGYDTTEKRVPIAWVCDEYDEEEEGDFYFYAAFDTDVDYLLESTVDLPVILLSVITSEDFTFSVNPDGMTVTVTGWKKSGDTLHVPDYIGDAQVTAIADYAFAGHDELLDVQVPGGVERMGSGVFDGCTGLRWAELPDSLTGVGGNLFDEAVLDELALTLAVYDVTTLTAPDTYKRGDDTVKLPRAISSLKVNAYGNLTVDTDFTVEISDNFNTIDVQPFGILTLNEGKKIVNLNNITVGGTFNNNGTVYGCYSESTLDGSIANYVTTHTDLDIDGVCDICCEAFGKTERQLTVTLRDGLLPLTKAYDGGLGETTLTAADFTLQNVAEEDAGKVSIARITATYDKPDVGADRKVTVQFTLNQDSENYNYKLASVTYEGSITAKDISDADIAVQDIADMLHTGEELEPEITVKRGSKALEEGVDYTVEYADNVKVGTAKVSVKGIGGYTGTVEKTFKILAEKEKRALSAKLKDGVKLSKVYDGSSAAPLTLTDFTLDTAKVAEGDTVELTAITASYDSADVGETKPITVKFTLKQSDSVYDYTLADLTLDKGAITARNITEAAINPASIPDQKHTGSAVKPEVTLTYGSKTLAEGRDYTVAYANNTKAGTATMTITGKGNFNGAKDMKFRIVDKDKSKRELTVELISGYEPSKLYDKTTAVTMKPSWFTLENVADGDTVKITAVKAAFDTAAVGEEKQVKVSFELSQSSTQYNYTVEPITVEGTILPRPLTIIPAKGQSKVYGTKDPTHFKGTVRGLLEGDTITGSLSREGAGEEDGEDAGKYEYTLGTLKAAAYYEMPEELESEEVFTITQKPLTATDVTVTLDKTEYTLDDDEVEPEITVKYGTITLEEDDDYTVTFENNKKVGTGTAIITAHKDEKTGAYDGNYTGTRSVTFKIKKGSSSGGHSGGSSDDDDEEEDEEIEYPTNEEGFLMLPAGEAEVPVGYILFGEDNYTRPFDQECLDSDYTPDPAHEYLPEELGEDGEPLPYQDLVIQPWAMMDPEGNVISMTDELDEGRDRYELVHLRLTPMQISLLKLNHIVNLVYQIENVSMRVPLAELTDEVDLTRFLDEEAQQESAYADEEEHWEDEETEEEESDDADEDAEEDEEEAKEAGDKSIAPPVAQVKNYVFTIDQVERDALTEREKTALKSQATLLPMYRVDLSAVDGELEAYLTRTGNSADTASVVEPPVGGPGEPQKPLPNFYSMLEVFPSVELRINELFTTPDDYDAETGKFYSEEEEEEEEETEDDEESETDEEMTEDEEMIGDADEEETEEDTPVLDPDALPPTAQTLIVSNDEKLTDEDAIRTMDPDYVYEDENGDSFARFMPDTSGLYTIVMKVPSTGDEEEEAEDEIEDEADAEDDAEEAETAEPAEAEPEEDEALLYAYTRRSNEGSQYWLIDTEAKTVEFYRADTDEYDIGDYTGSLISGMLVTFRNSGETTTIELKFPQTYKFATMDDNGTPLLMEQAEIPDVESALQPHRG